MANAKFKVGDKVKVIGANGFNNSTSIILTFIGKTGEITEVRKYPDGDIGYCFNNETNGMEDYCFDERSLEKVIENKNWFNIDIRSEGDKTVAYYIDRNGEQKVSVFRYKDDEYDPVVAVDYLMQKVDFSGAKAKVETKDDNWQCGDLVMWNDEKAEIVAMSKEYLLLDFKFENMYTHDAKGGILEAFTEGMVDRDGKPWKSDGQSHYYIVNKNDPDLELLKAVHKVEEKIPEAHKPKSKIPEIEFPFEIGDRIYIKNKYSPRINNKTATVVAHDVTDGACLVKVDVPDDCFHKGGSNGNSYKNIVDENGVPYKFSGKPEYWWITEKRFGELIKDEKPVSAKFKIGDRVMCTYGYSYTATGYGTVVAYSNNFGLENGYLVEVDSKYRDVIPCHDGLEGFYDPYTEAGKKWTNSTGKKNAFRYFDADSLKKVK